MTHPPFPLFDAFQALRRRQFNVGLPEYLLALEALQHGFGTGSREALIAMCQTLWANSLDEQYTVAAVLDDLLPVRWTQAEVENLWAEVDRQQQTSWKIREEGMESDVPESRIPEDDRGTSAQSQVSQYADTPRYADVGVRDYLIAPTIQFRHARLSLDFVGGLPVTRRQMKRAWRYYRRMQRAGPPTEFDVRATVEAMYRTGVLEQPVLVPRRTNQARMLLLIDEGGSMLPFRYVVRPLVETAQHGGLARTAAYYFHDAPGDYLFHDPRRTRPERFEKAVAPFKGAGVLIVSDAGAARGNYDTVRLRDTLRFLEQLASITPRVAWVNPTPEARWARTTAAAICRASDIRMFSLDRPGLDAAVDVLRGRER